MPLHDKHFTREEARRWLPELRARFERARSLFGQLAALRQAYEAVQRKVRSNGHAVGSVDFEGPTEELRALLADIADAGIQIKDIARGLVDFPSLRDGHEVYLCWEYGEEDILYWHEVDAGYAGRRPLDPE